MFPPTQHGQSAGLIALAAVLALTSVAPRASAEITGFSVSRIEGEGDVSLSERFGTGSSDTVHLINVDDCTAYLGGSATFTVRVDGTTTGYIYGVAYAGPGKTCPTTHASFDGAVTDDCFVVEQDEDLPSGDFSFDVSLDWLTGGDCGVGTEASAQSEGADARAYEVEVLVRGSALHGIHGIDFDPSGRLFVGSVLGESIYEIDRESGAPKRVVPPPMGTADDLAFGPPGSGLDGHLVWTHIREGEIWAMAPGGRPRAIVRDVPAANALAFDAEGRLFVSQTFGPDLRYISIPKDNPQNQSPAALQQYYGRAKIDPATRTMLVSLHDLDGKSLWEVKLDPEA